MKKLLLILLSITTLFLFQCKNDEEVNTNTTSTNTDTTSTNTDTTSTNTTNLDGTIGSVKDIDGNTYKTVMIGKQTWMAENLKVTKYNDGTEIPLVTDNDVWKSNFDIHLSGNTSTKLKPMMCYYENDINNTSTYGALYNWYVVSSNTNGGKNLCPVNWHVSTAEDWRNLSDYVGSNAGMKLTSTSKLIDGSSGTDDYGFSSHGGGDRSKKGEFYRLDLSDYWCSTSVDTHYAWGVQLHSNTSVVQVDDNNYKVKGYSVRCVRD